MKTFRCQKCGQALFFENVECLNCKSQLAFLPDRMTMAAIEPIQGSDGRWQIKARGRRRKAPRQYRLCRNTDHAACNFVVPAEDDNPYCVACRLTRVLPDLSKPENHQRWYRIEVAKRRLFYTLAKLGLISPEPQGGEPDGPVFEFLEDLPGAPVMTGHSEGLITINVAEADDDERVRRRVALHEPYRTLLGHFRHEIGHYYWDVLIRDGNQVEPFREVFGDESVDYGEALRRHYEAGGNPANWQLEHVSAYATSHPWEDWAETWAHYLHMVDLLETAASYNTRITLPGDDEDELEELVNPFEQKAPVFEELVEQWVPITLLVNSLNRSLGQEDAYPFALTAGALRKLRYVHDVIQANRKAQKVDQGLEQPPA
ncbi:MAG: hypothetical protein JWP65_839 [Ramlibacter sp.]|jgi:hypothetical protein|uniref:zinc-binding metallopeptidase family protein n=1 Tax=Ramlibacter sp. TaxID=1917967 RepID=UPI002634F6F2|nr:putative zinc-binding peptidase [Ramlibacter sp.]MDB5750418.1 hypothetical protein [Ramlibacter sp.]